MAVPLLFPVYRSGVYRTHIRRGKLPASPYLPHPCRFDSGVGRRTCVLVHNGEVYASPVNFKFLASYQMPSEAILVSKLTHLSNIRLCRAGARRRYSSPSSQRYPRTRPTICLPFWSPIGSCLRRRDVHTVHTMYLGCLRRLLLR